VEWFRRFFGEEYLKLDRHQDTLSAVDFIEQALHLEPGQRVLDLCCGYGRHAVELARRGYRVFGYDLSPVLLGRAQQNASGQGVEVHWTLGDMRRLPYGPRFDAVISMFTSLGYFDQEVENFRVLQGMSQVLGSGGRFVIETVNRDFLVRHFLPLEWSRHSGMLVLEKRSFDVARSRSDIDVIVLENGVETALSHSIRVYGFTELQMLLASVGLNTSAVFGGFAGEAFTWDSERMIVVGESADQTPSE
jgi:SAM-dependent methyltransferase